VDPVLRLDRPARALLVVGFLITFGTGAGLYLAPVSGGHSFAWPIKAPLTASLMGSGYLAGAALGLALALRDGGWPRIRVILAPAFVLVTTNLITTIHFFDQFKLGSGSGRQQVTAWTWLIVYAALPPAVAVVAFTHERRSGRAGWAVSDPLAPIVRQSFVVVAGGFAVLGLWLMIAPGALVDRWVWKLPPLSASIVGTWLLTLATAYGWAALERDWRRVRLMVVPVGLSLALNLVALVRFHDTRSGSSRATALYVSVIVVSLIVVLSPIGVRRASQAARPATSS
jgi:hypothetical protein